MRLRLLTSIMLLLFLCRPLLTAAEEYSNGELPASTGGAANINDAAGDGDTTDVWSADKTFDEVALKANKSGDTFTGPVLAPLYGSTAGDGAHKLRAANTVDYTCTVNDDGAIWYNLTLGKFRKCVSSAAADMFTDTSTAAGDVAFTPTGTIEASNVQAAIVEVAAEAGAGGSFSVTERTTAPSAGDLGANTFAIDTLTGTAYVQAATGMLTISGTWTANPSAGITDDFSSDTSGNYTTILSGGVDVVAGVAISGTAWTGTAGYHSTSTASNDHYIQATLERTTNDAAGIIFAFDPVTNGGYVAYPVTTGVVIKSISTTGVLTGLDTYIVSGGVAADTADVVKIEVSSGTATVFYGGTQIGTKSITVHGQYVGLYFDNGNNEYAYADNLTAGAL